MLILLFPALYIVSSSQIFKMSKYAFRFSRSKAKGVFLVDTIQMETIR